MPDRSPRESQDRSVDRARELAGLSFDRAPVPGVIVDAAGRVALVNGMARQVFHLSHLDVSRPFQDLELSSRPVPLCPSIETAYRSGRPVLHRDVELALGPRRSRFLDIEVMPLFDGDHAPAGASITFADVTRQRQLEAAVAQTAHQLAEAYDELQATNDELEATNGELKRTVDDLERTDHEVRSVDEAMRVAAAEHRRRGDELDAAKALLEAILSGLP